MAASQDQDFGTANLHVEVSDVVSVLVYVGVAKGNGVLSKTGKAHSGLVLEEMALEYTCQVFQDCGAPSLSSEFLL